MPYLVFAHHSLPCRLGRTARAGREGAGLLILADWEAPALLPELADLPIQPAGECMLWLPTHQFA